MLLTAMLLLSVLSAWAQTDFIFAVAGEELGFIGTVIIVILLLLIVIECILIARKAKDLAGRLICCGMAALERKIKNIKDKKQ